VLPSGTAVRYIRHLSLKDCPGLVACNFPPQAILLPSWRSVGYIIAMSVEPREIGEAARSACPHIHF